MQDGYFRRHDRITAIAAGTLFGVVAQLAVRLHVLEGLFGVMSLGYVFVLPLVLGAISALAPHEPPSRGRALLNALSTSILCLLIALLVGWEGTICVVMAAPVYLLLAMAGAMFGRALRGHGRGGATRRLALALCAVAPLASAGAETGFALPEQRRVVATSIEIAATPERVWPEIARVRRIDEPQESFFFTMGFPRPVEATLSYEGVGAVRHASFERGLLFIETVTHWEPPRALAFSIAVDPGHTPLTTLDAHVTVGGLYFDVLDGGYRIERLGPERVRLHLASTHRVSTRYNFYTSLWSDYLMREIQDNILRVLKQRCETPR